MMAKKFVKAIPRSCFGVGSNGKKVFEEREEIVLLVFNDASVMPLCRCYENLSTGRCNPNGDNDVYGHPDDYGVCVFYSGGQNG